MLPVSTAAAGAGSAKRSKHRLSPAVWYLRRLLKPTQMDFQYTFWMMRQLCLAPKTAYRQTSYHKQTKNHWARDDPAFAVVCCALVAAITAAYCLAFGHGFGRCLLTILSAVFVDFLGVGCGVATAGWALSNRLLRRKSQHSHAVEQSVEWMYAFDVHCNAAFPALLLLGPVQLALSPLLLSAALVPRALSAALWALAASHYLYLTFLGYSSLPFLERTEAFLYPIGGVALLAPLAVLAGANPTRLALRWYFGYGAA